MNQHLIFATSLTDARAEMEQLDLDFDDTTWVRGPEYLAPDFNYGSMTVHYTVAYMLEHPENQEEGT